MVRKLNHRIRLITIANIFTSYPRKMLTTISSSSHIIYTLLESTTASSLECMNTWYSVMYIIKFSLVFPSMSENFVCVMLDTKLKFNIKWWLLCGKCKFFGMYSYLCSLFNIIPAVFAWGLYRLPMLPLYTRWCRRWWW